MKIHNHINNNNYTTGNTGIIKLPPNLNHQSIENGGE